MELKAQALKISYSDAAGHPFDILDIDRLTVSSGTSLAITGPSGSGKTTLLYALSGLIETVSGEVRWDGTDVVKLPRSACNAWRRRTLGFVFQDFHLVPELSPLQNVLLPAGFSMLRATVELRQRAKHLLDQFRVPSSRTLSSQLSRGEQQRVALARALLFDPPVIMADEPTASLDEASAAAVGDELTALARERQKLVLIVTHDRSLIERCGDELALQHGHAITGTAQ